MRRFFSASQNKFQEKYISQLQKKSIVMNIIYCVKIKKKMELGNN